MEAATDPPIWLLDVDGVINANRAGHGWHEAPRRGTAFHDNVAYKLTWAPKLVTGIRSIYREKLAEILWCSSWCIAAGQIERVLALPSFGKAAPDIVGGPEGWPVKLEAALAVRALGRRLVWTDDEAIPASGPLDNDPGALLIRPRPNRGLQPEDLKEIVKFCRAGAPA